MVEKESDGFLIGLWKVINFCWSSALSLIWVLIYAFLILGATSSIILLIKLFPEQAIKLFTNPLLLLWLKIVVVLLNILFGLIVGLAILYILIKYIGMPFVQRSKERNLQRREQFKKEVINEIIKGVKNARRKRA